MTLTLTLRSWGYVDLVHTYLPYKYGHDRRSLRQSNVYFKVWPWKVNIWPWGQKFKIPPPKPPAGSPKEHFCAFLSLSYQNCRRSSQKYEKMPKIDQFSPRTSWAENRSTTKRMPGRYFFQDTPTLPISWWSDLGNIVKSASRTDGRTRWRHPAFLYLRWSQIKID